MCMDASCIIRAEFKDVSLVLYYYKIRIALERERRRPQATVENLWRRPRGELLRSAAHLAALKGVVLPECFSHIEVSV